ncbi:MAG: UbiA family prenyltransferase [Chloroflexus sp.]|nr:UbiA family prenyltransferase [Chloroflexus sp.]
MHIPTSIPAVHPPRWLTALLSEIHLYWRFTRYDISATIIPGMLFVLAAWHSDQPNWSALPGLLLWGTVYFWLYCTTFCISNQLAGEAEDRRNKPDRPLPSGLISRRGAWLRWIAAMALFTLVGWWLGVLEWTLLWQMTLTLHNLGGFARHYWLKNLSMTLGAIAQLAAAWQMVRPLTPEAWIWLLVPAVTLLSNASLQDLRDIEGDRLSHRRTMPIVFGADVTRVFVAVAFALLALLTHFTLFAPAGLNAGLLLLDVLLAGLCLVIAGRVLLLRTTAADHVSYMLYTYWYCFVLAAAIVAL